MIEDSRVSTELVESLEHSTRYRLVGYGMNADLTIKHVQGQEPSMDQLVSIMVAAKHFMFHLSMCVKHTDLMLSSEASWLRFVSAGLHWSMYILP